MTEAKDIHLSKDSRKKLMQIAEGDVRWDVVEKDNAMLTLEYYSLITHSRNASTAIITEKGRQVLMRYAQESQNRRSEHLHNWLIAIFSTIGGALLSKPIWAGIEWLINWLSQIM